MLGANDGLLLELSLVMGVAGAPVSADTVLVTGLAGLLAGACSMAMGEWVSVQSARELAGHQLAIEARELERDPRRGARGAGADLRGQGPRRRAGARAGRAPDRRTPTALDTLAREELGIDPDELGGSAAVAAAASFVLFAIGASVPVLPFFFLSGAAAVLASAR